MGVQRLTADEEMKERKIKERVLKLSLEDVRCLTIHIHVTLTVRFK